MMGDRVPDPPAPAGFDGLRPDAEDSAERVKSFYAAHGAVIVIAQAIGARSDPADLGHASGFGIRAGASTPA
jgi:hypothetical protein